MRASPRRAPAARPVTKALDPILTSVKATFQPFNVEKGVSAPLIDGRPSQKFMAKAQTQITLASGQGFCFMQGSNFSLGNAFPSLIIAVGGFTGGRFTNDGAWKQGTVGDLVGPYGTITRLSTNTPYTATTANNDGIEYACVSSGMRFTYEGSELYKGGTFRYIYDKDGAYNGTGDWQVRTPNGLIDFVNAAANTIRQSINKDNVVEINSSITPSPYIECSSGLDSAYGVPTTAGQPPNNVTALIGGTLASSYFCTSPSVIGYYVNTSGNTISFHIDVVEHWNCSGSVIQSLQTPSYSHVAMSSHVDAVMANVRQDHASKPHTKHVDVAKSTVAAMKSPLGHEILNIGLKAALA